MMTALPPPDRCGVIGTRPLPLAGLTAGMVLLEDDPARYRDVDAFVFLDSETWTEARQNLLEQSLAYRARPLVVCNPDIVAPLDHGLLSAEPGHFAHRAAAVAAGVTPRFLGKPFPDVYRKVAAAIGGIAPDRVLCVGDTPHTDILGARAFGFRAMLVESGFLEGRNTLAHCAEAGIWPDFVAAGL
jgi:ribonucleotide monophosphatase NagD (HAD superfamily)